MKLCVLDKDGTLVAPKSGAKFVQSPGDQMLLPGVAEKIFEMSQGGYKFAIATNQGGVAANHKTLNNAIDEVLFCMDLLPQIEYALIAHSYETEHGECIEIDRSDGGQLVKPITHRQMRFRKPEAGMLVRAKWACSEFPSNWEHLLMIGDREEDQSAADKANFDFLWASNWLESL